MSYELDFLKALAVTVVTEALIVFLSIKGLWKKESPGNREILSSGVLPSLTTLPYVWFIFPAWVTNHENYVIASEAFAVAAETFLIALLLKTSLKNGFLLSLTANTGSFLLGLIFLK